MNVGILLILASILGLVLKLKLSPDRIKIGSNTTYILWYTIKSRCGEVNKREFLKLLTIKNKEE